MSNGSEPSIPQREAGAGAGDATVEWDPQQYLRFADQRARPFADLLARIGAEEPTHVVDLGCGPGTLTAGLLDRWPAAFIEGVDSSAEMIERAGGSRIPGRVEFVQADLRHWRPERRVDLLLSNSTLQWVPGHLELLPRLVECIDPGGWIGFQLPANFDEPSHRLLAGLAGERDWSGAFAGTDIARPSAAEPTDYLTALVAAGCVDVDVWETTYLVVLPPSNGAHPVLEWVKGTAARPYLQALSDADRPVFEQVYAERLQVAYPPRSFGTVLPYRRIFAVARRSSSG